MSTYIYLQCDSHEPALRSEGDVGQHLTRLPQVREDLANKEELVKAYKKWWDDPKEQGGFEMPDDPFGYRRRTVYFLTNHPNCEISIHDEYGVQHALTEENA